MSQLKKLVARLNKEAHPQKAEFLKRYFKTASGEYGAGDLFLGITVPIQRKIAHSFPNLPLSDVETLLEGAIHEYRFTALENLVYQYEHSDEKKKKQIFYFYLSHTKGINNWDLVDTSASYIVGNFLFNKSRKVLYKLAKSNSMWERRIAIIATHYFINQKEFTDTFEISKILLKDNEDLIHKACGWSLREVGKKDVKALKDFLKMYYKIMPRTTLRYAIERFSKEERQMYLKGLI